MSDITDVVPTEEQIHDLATKTTSVKLIEDSLGKFLNDTFEMARQEDVYQQAIKNAIIAKLPDMKASELIALATSASTNKNDLISKLVSPTMQLLTAAQQNELAQKQKEQTPHYTQNNIKELNAATPTDILVGLQALQFLAEKVQLKDKIAEATVEA